ncbi:MAG: hypothetical protein WC512_07165 [Candidatus Omnitrophota bacterium]
MKKEYLIFAAILAVIFSVWIFGKNFILGAAEKQLRSAFPGYKVTIGNTEVKTADLVSFSNIEISKGESVRYRARELDIRLGPLTLLNRTVPKVSINGCSIVLSSPSAKVNDLVEMPAPKPGAMFIVDSLEINEMNLEIHTSDCDLSAIVRANASVKKDIKYDAVVKVNSIDLGLLPKFFDASQKFGIKGKMSGEIELAGKDLELTSIKGEFTTDGPGGIIEIKDEGFIKMLAERSRQPVDIIRSNFKYYNYTEGKLEVSKDGDVILLRLKMDGKQGKRDLTAGFDISRKTK